MRVAILTITDGANYGNRLQNYAMQEVLMSLGYEVETVKCDTFRDVSGVDKLKVIAKDSIKKVVGKKNTNFQYRARKARFESYNKKYLKFSKYHTANNEAPPDLKYAYDYFVCGSDQIWNARFPVVSCNIKNYLAAFAEMPQRVAFAASFGTRTIAPGFEELFANELKNFKAIAVRENAGKEIVDSITGKTEAEVVLDPTLLIEKEKWIEIEKKPDYIKNERFLVTYFLGGRSCVLNEYIKSVARENDLEIINLESEFFTDNQIENPAFFQTSPDEFIWLMHHARYILTDSFHASVFSIIFEKPFLVFERIAQEKGNDMGSRIVTLLSTFHLMECRDDITHPKRMPTEQDYTTVTQILNLERKRSVF